MPHRIFWASLLFWLLLAPTVAMAITLGKSTTIVYADVDQARQLLGEKDEFIQGLSPFDRASRVKTDKPVDTKAFLNFVQKHVKPWQVQDKARLKPAFNAINQHFANYQMPLPQQIVLIKTSGAEEGNATAYTRGTAIMVTEKFLAQPAERIEMVMLHEIFHIMSRHEAIFKKQMYGVIGFQQAGELQFPTSLRDRKLTNPDAPINNHYITLKHQGSTVNAVPILFSRQANYDMAKGGEFFDYLSFKLLVVAPPQQGKPMQALKTEDKLQLLGVGEVPDFMAQIGQNTRYIIHPEEVLADNFAHLMMKKPGLKTPQITRDMQRILEQKPWH